MRINGIVVDNPQEGRFYLIRRSPLLRGGSEKDRAGLEVAVRLMRGAAKVVS